MNTETNRRLRGHNFYPPKDVLAKIPPLKATDGQGWKATVWVHYFAGSADWFVTELDPATGEAFGHAELFPGGGELGYFNLQELEQVKVAPQGYPVYVERDMHWIPVPLHKAVDDHEKRR